MHEFNLKNSRKYKNVSYVLFLILPAIFVLIYYQDENSLAHAAILLSIMFFLLYTTLGFKVKVNSEGISLESFSYKRWIPFDRMIEIIIDKKGYVTIVVKSNSKLNNRTFTKHNISKDIEKYDVFLEKMNEIKDKYHL